MSVLRVKYGSRAALIVGYAASEADSSVRAIIVHDGELKAVPLRDITLIDLPKRLRRKRRGARIIALTQETPAS